MITEDYVSFETAKLLKEKEFDWIVTRSYFENDGIYAPCDPSEVQRKDAIAIPTLQMAMKWLREVHNLAIELTWEHTWFASITKMTSMPESIVYEDGNRNYEVACEAAIKYCLENLI